MSTTCSSYAGGGQLNRNRSWPFWADTSAAARALSPATPMLSTVTSMLFFSPHSLMYFSLNHLSKAGTKCTHWMILRVFFALAPWDFDTKMVGPRPTPSAAAVVVLMKCRRVIRLRFIAYSLCCWALGGPNRFNGSLRRRKLVHSTNRRLDFRKREQLAEQGL